MKEESLLVRTSVEAVLVMVWVDLSATVGVCVWHVELYTFTAGDLVARLSAIEPSLVNNTLMTFTRSVTGSVVVLEVAAAVLRVSLLDR